MSLTPSSASLPAPPTPQIDIPTEPAAPLPVVTPSSSPRPQIGGLKRKANAMDQIQLAPPPVDVPEELKPVIATLTRLFHETRESLEVISKTHPVIQHELKEYSEKLVELFGNLSHGELPEVISQTLQRLCKALDDGDDALAFIIQMFLQKEHREECQPWLDTLDNLVAKSSLWTVEGGGRSEYEYQLRHTPLPKTAAGDPKVN